MTGSWLSVRGRWPWAWLVGVSACRRGIGRVLMDPPVEGGCGSVGGKWSFGERSCYEGASRDPRVLEEGEVFGQPGDGGVVVEALAEGPESRDVEAGCRGEELSVEVVFRTGRIAEERVLLDNPDGSITIPDFLRTCSYNLKEGHRQR